MFDSNRSQVSVGIQHDVNVFAGYVVKIEARNQSGYSIDDKVCQMHILISWFIVEL
jgi:hypothetical protein